MKNQIRHIFFFLFSFFLSESIGFISFSYSVQALDPMDSPFRATSEQTYEYQRIGKEIFQANCSVCHIGGTNIIIPEKNLKKNALEANGMNNLNAISYQIINGKNGMPAFGGRLQEDEIEILASYVLKQSLTNFVEN